MNILEKIVAHKRTELRHMPDVQVTVDSLRAEVAELGPRRDFIGSLLKPRRGNIGLIAEVKKASPSKGIIREDFDPVVIAEQYEAAGASCLSVLTDKKFFQGSLDYLSDIRQAVSLPLLRKDFIIDERQISEAIEWGADAVLLIVAILNDAKLALFYELATGAGLSVLVEVHDALELQRAQMINAPLIGVNNRNLKDFTVDLAVTESLASKMDLQQTLLVSESGIDSRTDVKRLTDCGARAILVGESLMREDDISAKVRTLGGQP